MPMKPRPFSPQRHGYILLKGYREFKGARHYERAVHPVVDGRPCHHRFNTYVSRDGDYFTVWQGYLDRPMGPAAYFNANGEPDPELPEDFILFRGNIRSAAQGRAIFAALNPWFRPMMFQVTLDREIIQTSLDSANDPARFLPRGSFAIRHLSNAYRDPHEPPRRPLPEWMEEIRSRSPSDPLDDLPDRGFVLAHDGTGPVGVDEGGIARPLADCLTAAERDAVQARLAGMPARDFPTLADARHVILARIVPRLRNCHFPQLMALDER